MGFLNRVQFAVNYRGMQFLSICPMGVCHKILSKSIVNMYISPTMFDINSESHYV